MKKVLKISTWILMLVALVFFWLSIRSTENNYEYTLIALGTIVLAWIANYFLRIYEKEKEN